MAPNIDIWRSATVMIKREVRGAVGSTLQFNQGYATFTCSRLGTKLGYLMMPAGPQKSEEVALRQALTNAQLWSKLKVPILVLSCILLILFLLLIVLSITVSSPLKSERLASSALICFSVAAAFAAFGFLSSQKANIAVTFKSTTINLSGALAAAVIVFVVFQYGIRGTTSLYIQLYADNQHLTPWLAPAGSVVEFEASLPQFSVIATPSGSDLRLFNLPVFENIRLRSRDQRWYVAELNSDDDFCSVDKSSISGWCSSVQAVVKNQDCIESWNGSGDLGPGTFKDVLDSFVNKMQSAGKSVGTRYDPTAIVKEMLAVQVSQHNFSGQGFCLAFQPFRQDAELVTGKKIRVLYSCTQIGIAVGDEADPAARENESWSPC
jgi:hypothetical protein